MLALVLMACSTGEPLDAPFAGDAGEFLADDRVAALNDELGSAGAQEVVAAVAGDVDACRDVLVAVVSEKPAERTRDPQITVVCDGLSDDSVRAERWVVQTSGSPGSYEVASVQRSWWCWSGRGAAGWRTTPCS